jgi:mannitol-1-phosphate 5-dehydrogenase
MTAVIIGPGRIGCGFAGQLLRASGHALAFIGRNRIVVDHLNRVGRYRVRLVGRSHPDRICEIDGVRALWNGERERAARAIADAEVVVTAVGPGSLPDVAPLIAAGLRRRDRPLNILAFENLADVGHRLQALVKDELGDRVQLAAHGLSGALVSRIVTERIGDPAKDRPLVFVGDALDTFVVHGPSLHPPIPRIKGMVVTDDYAACVARKLYMFCAGHATTAYLGALKGYHFVHTAIADPEIRDAVIAAMLEAQRGVRRRYGQQLAGEEPELLAIIERFENAALADLIVRVGRDPRRKLGPSDRLVGAARLALRAGIRPKHLAQAVAAGLCFLIAEQQANGATRVEPDLRQISGLDSHRGLGRLVANMWKQLAGGWDPGNLLLKLEPPVWAWQTSCAAQTTPPAKRGNGRPHAGTTRSASEVARLGYENLLHAGAPRAGSAQRHPGRSV